MSRVGLIIRILLLAGGMILAAGLSMWVVFAFLTRGGEVVVPNLSGVELKAALELTSRENLGLRVSGTGFNPGVPPGHVISQDPAPGIRTRKNRLVHVVVSQGTRTVFVPDVSGLTLRRAELALIQSGLSLGRVSRSFYKEIPQGGVLTQSPPPDLFVPRNTAVDLLLSNGPRPVVYVLPDPVGLPVEEVLTSVRSWGLSSGRILEVQRDDLPPGTVTAINPRPGSSVTEGQSVHLTVSRMPPPPDPTPVVLFQYSSPPGLMDKTLTLVLDTGDGPRTVWEEIISPGTAVSIPVPVSAEGILTAYLDGIFLEERKVP
jgi:serine/threonine-protein kinase